MKAKIEMVIEVNDNAEDFEISSCIVDALSAFTGNCVEFYDVQVSSVKPGIRKFTDDIEEVEALETFDATHINAIGGEKVGLQKTFVEGVKYYVESWRPEGMSIDGFFVFNKHANKFTRTK